MLLEASVTLTHGEWVLLAHSFKQHLARLEVLLPAAKKTPNFTPEEIHVLEMEQMALRNASARLDTALLKQGVNPYEHEQQANQKTA